MSSDSSSSLAGHVICTGTPKAMPLTTQLDASPSTVVCLISDTCQIDAYDGRMTHLIQHVYG